MQSPNFFILYVDDAAKSAAFYQQLLDCAPADTAPNFAMFKLESGVMLGLWARHDVQPATRIAGGGNEVAFSVDGRARVDALHAAWTKRGFTVAQAPVKMDFGYTFVVLDPDQHRVRVFAPCSS
jgi:predicted enzyme related to lactoylglutathione lyase